MRTNADITIFNKYRVANVDTWQQVQIEDAAWEQRHARSQYDSDDLATVFIPLSRGANYLKPRVWQALSSKTGKWTLQVGDVIVKGLVTFALSATPPFTLSALKAAYDDVLVITAVDTFDYGSTNLQHHRIGAK
jgi:hypothetical protein